MIRSQPESNIFEFEHEIERTFSVLKRARRTIFEPNLCDTTSSSHFNFDCTTFTVDMVNLSRTLKKLATPDVAYQPLCIQYLDTNVDFELKFGLIHLLPKFDGLVVRIHTSI